MSSVSGSMPETSTPPTVTAPSPTSQKRAASLAAVDLPEPDGPTRAVTSPSRAVKLTELSTGPPSS